MITYNNEQAFDEEMKRQISVPLDAAVRWIARNLQPEDVFKASDLQDWAESNGFIPEDDGEP